MDAEAQLAVGLDPDVLERLTAIASSRGETLDQLVGGLQACLWSSAVLVGLAAIVSTRLPTPPRQHSPQGLL